MDDADTDRIPFLEKVERLVEKRIRPVLRLHEGNLIVRDARDGQVWIVFTGACRSCPAAQITLEETVAQLLKEELGDEFTTVHLINETNEELLDFAKKRLKKTNK